MSKKSSFGRRISFLSARVTSTLSVSLVLFVLGIMALMGLVVNTLSRQVKENVGFTVIFNDTIQDSTQVQALTQVIAQGNYAKTMQFVSKEDALQKMTLELDENPVELLGYNPFTALLEVKVNSEYAHPDSLAKIAKELRMQESVVSVEYPKEIVQSVNKNMGSLGLVLSVLALLLMIISFALISNTIRLSVYSKRFLIHTMKLVGATSGFIRRPFIIANIVNGIFASIIAILLLLGCSYYLMPKVQGLEGLLTPIILLKVFGVVLVLGILLTALSAYWAVSRYIRKERDELYYI